jgi:hypothetical protein
MCVTDIWKVNVKLFLCLTKYLALKMYSVLNWASRHEVSGGSSDGTATGYGLDDRGSGVRFSAGAENFSLRHHVQTGSGAHPVGAGGSFLGSKAAEAWSWPLVPSEVKNAWWCTSTPQPSSWRGAWLSAGTASRFPYIHHAMKTYGEWMYNCTHS